ncbi:MAG: hypothetical protein ACYSUT_09630, partial [Planctomycetota bacterium]
MEIQSLKSWEEFEEIVVAGDIETQQLKNSCRTIELTTPLLYRGQSDSKWFLESILERQSSQSLTVESYFNIILQVWESKERFKDKWPNLKFEIENLSADHITLFTTQSANSQQITSFMAYLRHHGFPS